MYKCDLCHDRIKKEQLPVCVEACEKRLGKKKTLFFGERDEILKIAHERAKEISGFIYGEKENGGTATIYVSKVSFERIDARLRENKSNLQLGKFENPLTDANRWAKGFLIGPIISALGAVGLALQHKKDENLQSGNIARSNDEKENE